MSNFLPNYPVKATFDNGTVIPFVSSEKLGPVRSSNSHLMGYNYRLCFSNVTEKQAPFYKPTNYDPNDFLLLQRYLDSLVKSGKFSMGPLITDLVSLGRYQGYPPGDKLDVNRNIRGAISTDGINLNKKIFNKTAERRQHIAQKILDYTLGMFLYIREGLRPVNDHMFTQHDIVSGQCRNDSVAVGSWYFEVYVVTRTVNNSFVNNEGLLSATVPHINGTESGRTFEIPYSIILPKANEVTNLLVLVCHAATHVAYSAMRVEPHFLLLGSIAGYASVYAIQNEQIDVQSVDIKYIQQMLTNDDVLFHYPKGHCDH